MCYLNRTYHVLTTQEKYMLDTRRLQRENACCSAWGFADYSQRVRNQRVQINFGFTPNSSRIDSVRAGIFPDY
jgi:hypothetical protein